MSFSVRLTTDLVTVEAGATVPVTVEVVNKGLEVDRFELQIEGIDPEWTAVPEAVFIVDPGEPHSEKVFIKVPRVSESLAGNYPFVVRIRSLNSGEARTAQGVAQVKPFHYLTMDVGPKKGMYSPMRKNNVFTVSVLNLGNTEHTLQLQGIDPDEACEYDFEVDQVTVAPGQQRTVEMAVTPAATSFLASSRLHGFSVSGRSLDAPNVLASTQGQLEQRPFLTPGTLAFLVFFMIVVAAWIAMIPKPPKVSLSLSKRSAIKGETIQVTWRAENANGVQVFIDGVPLVSEPPINGETDYVTTKSGTVVFTAKATRDQRESETDAEQLTVTEPEPTPKPVATLRAKRRTINLGESVMLEYTVENAVEAYLQPGPQKLPVQLNSISVQPNKEGVVDYEIVATGKDGQVATARVSVTVIDKAKVVILAFGASPAKMEVGGGYVTVNWQASNAARVEITGAGEALVPENPNSPGSQEFMVDKTTTFTMKAIDANGKSTMRTVRVVVAQPADPPPGPMGPDSPPVSTPPGTTTGGGN